MRRRVVATLCVMVMGLSLFPARADAFWWDWLDDLSGPSFKGVTFNWRVWCQTDRQDAASDEAWTKLEGEIRSAASTLDRALETYRRSLRETTRDDAAPYFRAAIEAAERSREATLDAIGLAAARDVSVAQAFGRARTYDKLAAQYATWGEVIEKRLPGDTQVLPPPRVPGDVEVTGGVAGVFSMSLCRENPSKATRTFLSANMAIGTNTNQDYAVDDLRLVTVGASYHAVLAPYLTAGTGAGLAFFTSDSLETFRKFYVEPYVVDVRPGALPYRKIGSCFRLWRSWRRLCDGHSEPITDLSEERWWKELLAFRYSTLMFPQGFEPGRFRRQGASDGGTPVMSPRFPAELIHTWALHIDIEPLMRRLKN